MKILYVIDPTARQYGFMIEESITVKLGDTKYTITGTESDIDLFHDAMTNKVTITVYSPNNCVTFASEKLVGIKIAEE